MHNKHKYEKRQYRRLPIYKALSVFESRTKDYLGMVSNFSQGGVRITTARPLPNGQTVSLELLEDPEDTISQSAELVGKVVWSEKLASNFYDSGLEVLEWNKETKKLLKEICHGTEPENPLH